MIRPITAADMAEITRLRTSVKENHLSVEEMVERGITPAGIMTDLDSGNLGGWLEEDNGEILGFSMAEIATDRSLRSSQCPAAKDVASARACSTLQRNGSPSATMPKPGFRPMPIRRRLAFMPIVAGGAAR